MLLKTSQHVSIIIIYILLSVTLNMFTTKGANYIVGDSNGWTLIPDYANWTQGKEFHVGDTLEFNYESGLHNVMQVNSTAYEGCIKHPYMSLLTTGNDSVFLSHVGQFWYICGVDDHCASGQKLSINVIR